MTSKMSNFFNGGQWETFAPVARTKRNFAAEFFLNLEMIKVNFDLIWREVKIISLKSFFHWLLKRTVETFFRLYVKALTPRVDRRFTYLSVICLMDF